MSNKIRKKKIKNKLAKNSGYLKLDGVLLAHYNGFKFDSKLSKFKNSNHKKFNNMLRDYLISCQKNEFIPSKELVEKKCTEFNQEIDEMNSRKENNLEVENPKLIDFSIRDMDFLPIITRQDQDSNDYNGRKVYLNVIGIISLRNLIKKEIDTLIECFKEDGEYEDGFFKINLMNVLISEEIDEEKQDKINSYLKRFSRNKLKKHFKKKGIDTEFNYSIKDKIKDMWVDGGI